MNIIDSIIIVLFMLGVVSGLKNGVLKYSVTLLGTILIIVISYSFKNPIAEFFYKNLPFFEFGGEFKGLSVLNILLYETIAFLVVCSVLGIIYRIILKVTGVIEKVFNVTIVLGLISKLLGAALGFIQAYIVIFIILFFFKQPFINLTGVSDSKLANIILDKTPVLTKTLSKTRNSIDEIYSLKNKYKTSKNKDEYNKEVLEVFIKNNVISVDSVKTLKEKEKIKFNGLDSLIKKYGGKK